MRKHFFAIVFVILLFCSTLSLSGIVSLKTSANKQSTGYAIIKVLETGSLSPVINATICVVEAKQYYQTDKYGYSPKMSIPILTNHNFDISLQREFGEFTLIVYKPGYSTLVSYYNQVMPNSTNAGIVCYLNPIINQEDPLIISDANKPNSDYTQTLVQLYKK